MNKQIKIYGLLSILISVLFVIHGCSQLENNLTVAPEATTQCTLCHGSGDHPNPPKALNGDTVTTSRGVGAHMNHLLTPEISAGIQCSECHIPVNSFYDSTHIDRSNPDNRAEIKFGPLAKKIIFGGYIPNPKYDSVDYECSNVYCHGGFAGGNVMVVTWTNPDNVVCGSCHGSPTTGNPNPRPYAEYTHDINNTITDCAECHFATIDATGKIIHPENHINGVVNFGENR